MASTKDMQSTEPLQNRAPTKSTRDVAIATRDPTKPRTENNNNNNNHHDNQPRNQRSSYRLDRNNHKYNDYPRDRDNRDPRDNRDRGPRDTRDRDPRDYKSNDYREKHYKNNAPRNPRDVTAATRDANRNPRDVATVTRDANRNPRDVTTVTRDANRNTRDTRNIQNNKRSNLKSAEKVDEKPALPKEKVTEKPVEPENTAPAPVSVSKAVEKQTAIEGAAIKLPENKTKPSHGHYHHKNSNKPRFAKVFTEKEMKLNKDNSDVDTAIPPERREPGHNSSSSQKDETQKGSEQSVLLDELKIISQELSNNQNEDVFAKLKNGETIELDNLKQLYDKIPDITKSEIISKEEDWNSSLPPATDSAVQDNSSKLETVSGDASDNRASGACCPHGTCCPPFFHHGYMPPALPHPAYYYAALWNYHHPIPPPSVQRLANAPSLPSPADSGGAIHKRYITRSTKTPGSIAFTLHVSDNLRIVSVRCEDEFTMTADLCNEEGEKVAENFALHNETSPKLWEQYAFSGNHTLHFNIDAPSPTVVVVTFLHEILIS